jgi:gamma-glutamyltranspeptidase/glutathione hydrolase
LSPAILPTHRSFLEGHVQVLLNILRGMTPQAALDAPRFCISAGLPDADTEDVANAGNIDSEVWMEEGISDQVVQKLRGMLQDFPP